MTRPVADRALWRVALRRAGAFTVAPARVAGLSGWDVEERIRDGRWVRLHRGTYVERYVLDELADAPRQLLLAHAAALAAPADAVLSHHTAARLWRLPVVHPAAPSDAAPDHARAHVTVVRPGVAGRTSLRVHVAPLPEADVARTWGLVVTSVARTVVDLARTLAFAPALVTADAALRAGLTAAELSACLARGNARARGMRAARLVVEHADGRAESPLESLVRALCVEFGLPRPRLQAPLPIGDCRWARVDFLWERQRVVGEADGRAKYDTVGELDQERRREAALVAAGFRVIRFGWPAATARRAETAALLRRVLDA